MERRLYRQCITESSRQVAYHIDVNVLNIRNSYPNISHRNSCPNISQRYHLFLSQTNNSIKSSLLPEPLNYLTGHVRSLNGASVDQLLLVPRFPHPSSNLQPSPPCGQRRFTKIWFTEIGNV